ncbi:beta-ketoacyl synthase chain length factor [Kitasatospora viridis]|uniref:Beta-ketoacyl synthase-like protein n=1 Tax=Kitasatospora viridis TaxID=281105 RepID=A0A561UIR1_9ACTN|nr:beta-ketoacyl synthase chain length factor [Kitasatospora viridis]TWF99261.1 beta-ketoacyl synthase-like protein [Kitasatospora viridis]
MTERWRKEFERSGFTVLASAEHDPQGGRPAPVPGFVASDFPGLVAGVADRCLGRRHAAAPLAPEAGERTALLLVSPGGDQETARTIADLVDAGKRVSPLLFFQSVPNSIGGKVTSRWGITGPLVCISPVDDPVDDASAQAELMLATGEVDEVLVVLAELAGPGAESDQAVAVLLGPGGPEPRRHPNP